MRVRGFVRLCLWAAVIPALSACGTIMPIFKPDRPPPVEIVIPPEHPEAPAAVVTVTPPAYPRPKPVAEAPLPTAKDLIGLSVDEVRAMIGKPSLLREDHKVQVWHYRNLDCTLFLFFYPKGEQGYRVSNVDVADTRSRPARKPGMTPSQVHEQMLESCVASTMISYGSRRL